MLENCKVCGIKLTDKDPKISYFAKKAGIDKFFFEGYCQYHYREIESMRHWRKKGLPAIEKELERIEYRKSLLLKTKLKLEEKK